jgi:hypothetical protein
MVLDRGSIAAAAVVVAGALASVGVPACQAGVAPATTYDQPIASFESNNFSVADPLAGTKNPTFGVIWTDPFQVRPDVVMPAGWAGSDLTRDTVAAFKIQLYRPPPPEAIVTVTAPWREEAELAFGEIVIFDDLDHPDGDGGARGDGTFSVSGPHAEITLPDRYIAGSFQVLVYVARPFSHPDKTFLTFPIFNFGFTGYAIIDYACKGLVSNNTSQRTMATFVPLPGQLLPEVRLCRRTHSP